MSRFQRVTDIAPTAKKEKEVCHSTYFAVWEVHRLDVKHEETMDKAEENSNSIHDGL